MGKPVRYTFDKGVDRFPDVWLEPPKDGKPTLRERASREVERLIARYTPSRLPDDRKADLTRLMEAEAKRHAMSALPEE